LPVPFIFICLIDVFIGCLVCRAHDFLKVEDFHFRRLSSLGVIQLVVGRYSIFLGLLYLIFYLRYFPSADLCSGGFIELLYDFFVLFILHMAVPDLLQ
jgi:hypothetical protein